ARSHVQLADACLGRRSGCSVPGHPAASRKVPSLPCRSRQSPPPFPPPCTVAAFYPLPLPLPPPPLLLLAPDCCSVPPASASLLFLPARPGPSGASGAFLSLAFVRSLARLPPFLFPPLTCPGLPAGRRGTTGSLLSSSHDPSVCPRDQRLGSRVCAASPLLPPPGVRFPSGGKTRRKPGRGALLPLPLPFPPPSLPSTLPFPPWTCSIQAWTQPTLLPTLLPGDGTNADEQTAVAIASVQQGAFSDHNIQYQFRTENNGGQVTYRVVQVTDSQLDGQTDATGAVSVVSTAAFTSGQQAVAQAVIQNPFSNGGSPAADTVSGEARFAYFPASTVGDATAVSVQTTDQSLTQAGGQFYVMMTPQDVLQTGTQRTIAPRTHPYSPKMDGTRTPRDERRRAQHNEVERRRRDKINNWIVQLSKIIPDCNTDNTKTGASKGGILSKACDYIRELRQTNQRMQETFKEAERLQMDNDLLQQQIEELKNENALLRAQLQQHGIEIVGDTPGQ
uniref:Upstream stimulatory factor 2 n=1 Tax=Anolis carolinensis TaxID=28377 RepID=A0A803TP61_ANOCA